MKDGVGIGLSINVMDSRAFISINDQYGHLIGCTPAVGTLV